MPQFYNAVLAKDTTDCTAANTGALQVSGGAYVTKQFRISGILTSLNSTDSTSYTNGSFVTLGGIGATGAINTHTTITAEGTITGASFNGSGAGLTGIPNTALSNSAITIGTTGISLGGSSTSLAGLTTLAFTSAGYISMPNGAQRGIQFNYGSLGSLYSSAGTMLGSNVYVNPADTVSRQVRIKNTHATYGYAYYKQEDGSHTWYGATGSVTADDIVAPTTQMTLNSTGLTVTGTIVKSGGTAAQFLKANGSVDASAYVVSGGALGTPSSGNLTNCSFPTLNQSTTGSAGYLKVLDTRKDVTTPESLNGPLFRTDFKQNTVEGLSDGGTYFGEMTFRPYGSSTDWSGGPAHQLGFTQNGNVYHRKGTSTTWGSWYKFWDSGNLDPTSYQPVSTILSSLSGLASSTGWLHNDGAGALAYTTPTAAQVGADASGTAASAVSTHAALRTGIHGITIASGKTFTCNNTLTLSGTDASTLNIGGGGTLGTGAYAAAYSLPTATSSVLGGVKPDGTSILNSSGVLSATPASIGALASTATAADSSKLGGVAAASYLVSGGALGTPSGGNLANCTFPTLNQSTTGSAATLTTARAINGTNFNGSADITVPLNTTNDNATATTCYPVWVTAAGNYAAKIAASSLTFVPSTGVLGITTIQATGDITAYYSSDRRLKRNIKPIENPIEKLKQISGVTFDWSEEYLNQHGGEDGFFVRKHDVGFIAQEVQAVLPEIVGERKDHFLGLKYDRMTVLLAEAVKEQQVQIEAQQAQIERLLAALGMK